MCERERERERTRHLETPSKPNACPSVLVEICGNADGKAGVMYILQTDETERQERHSNRLGRAFD